MKSTAMRQFAPSDFISFIIAMLIYIRKTQNERKIPYQRIVTKRKKRNLQLKQTAVEIFSEFRDGFVDNLPDAVS